MVADERGIAGRSRFVRSFLQLRASDDPFIERLNAWTEDVVGPCAVLMVAGSDAYLDALSAGRAELRSGLRVVGSGRPALDWFREKRRSYELAADLGIGVPRTCYVRSRDELEQILGSSGMPAFPVLLKSEQSQRLLQSHGIKGITCATPEEVLAAYDRFDGFFDELLVQEYVPGPERGQVNVLAVVSQRGQPMALFVNEKLRTASRFLSCTLMRSRWSDEAVEATLKLLRAARFEGTANAEFKRDPRDGTLKLLEVNARLTVSNSHALRSGVDLVHAAYRSALNEEPWEPLPPHGGQRDGILWWYPAGDIAGMVRSTVRGELHPLRWIRDGLGRGVVVSPWALRDPCPGLWSVLRAPVALRRRGRRRRNAAGLRYGPRCEERERVG
jgi:predicted ATP-grasp superfamily ATP-dependent carboligase